MYRSVWQCMIPWNVLTFPGQFFFGVGWGFGCFVLCFVGFFMGGHLEVSGGSIPPLKTSGNGWS